MGNFQPVYPSKSSPTRRSGAMDFQPVLSQAEGSAPSPPVQQPAPPAQTVAPPQDVLTPQPSPRRKIIILVLVLLVLVGAVLALLWFTQKAPKAAAKVGREKISFETVNNFSRDCDLAQKEAVEYLVDEKVLTAWADDEKISISAEEQKAEELRISGVESPADCLKLEAKVNLLREKLSQNTTKFREGKFIAVNFGLYANPNPIQVTQEATGEAQRSQKLKEDKVYADTLVNSIYPDLKGKKISFEEAMEKVKNDPKVGTNSPYATSFQSGPFTAHDYIEKRSILNSEAVRQKVDGLKVGEISEPFIQQADVSFCEMEDPNCQPKYVDSRWLIIQVEKIGQGYEETGEKLIAKIRDKYDAKIFIK